MLAGLGQKYCYNYVNLQHFVTKRVKDMRGGGGGGGGGLTPQTGVTM